MDAIHIEHVAKTYDGAERSLRGTKLEWKGPALWLRNLSRGMRLTSSTAPPVTALRDVSLTVDAGEVFGLIGQNGAGKTTLIKILAGLIRPSAGVGLVAGMPFDRSREIRSRVSYVSTTGWMGLEWPLTAEENVRLFAALCGMPPRLARARTEAALRDVGMWADRRAYSAQLSNGMRQRVILARALLLETPVVLLDEPTVGLDPNTAETLIGLIREKLRERGQAIVMADHQTAELESVADRIGILHDGYLGQIGTRVGLLAPLRDVTVIEIRTEEMDPPLVHAPPAVIAAGQRERPGALGVREWQIYVRRSPEALQTALDWIEQPAGRIVFLGERAPTLQDLLALPEAVDAREEPVLAEGAVAG